MPLDWGDVGGGVIGGSLALGGNLLLQVVAHKAERRRRAEQRSEEAAKAILDAFSEAQSKFRFYRLGDVPDDNHVTDLVSRLNVAAVDLRDHRIRTAIGKMTTALDHMGALAEWAGTPPSQVTRVLRREADKMLGRMRRAESFEAASDEIDDFIKTIEDYWATYEDAWKGEEERKKRERESPEESRPPG